MPSVSAADLVTTWERGGDRHPIDRALLLLALGDPEADPDVLPRLCLGEREDRLFALHAAWFGDRMDCLTNCPSCGETVEFALSVDALRQRPPPVDPAEVRLVAGDLAATVRLPDSLDLAAAAREATPARAREALLRRCVVELQRGGSPLTPGDLDEPERVALSEAIGEADPRAETLLETACPRCGHAWTAPLDLVAYLWGRVDREAEQLLDAVDVLARVYGWSEDEVFHLTPTRRRLYLQRATA